MTGGYLIQKKNPAVTATFSAAASSGGKPAKLTKNFARKFARSHGKTPGMCISFEVCTAIIRKRQKQFRNTMKDLPTTLFCLSVYVVLLTDN